MENIFLRLTRRRVTVEIQASTSRTKSDASVVCLSFASSFYQKECVCGMGVSLTPLLLSLQPCRLPERALVAFRCVARLKIVLYDSSGLEASEGHGPAGPSKSECVCVPCVLPPLSNANNRQAEIFLLTRPPQYHACVPSPPPPLFAAPSSGAKACGS